MAKTKEIVIHFQSITLPLTPKEHEAVQWVEIRDNEKLRKKIMDRLIQNFEEGLAIESCEEA